MKTILIIKFKNTNFDVNKCTVIKKNDYDNQFSSRNKIQLKH